MACYEVSATKLMEYKICHFFIGVKKKGLKRKVIFENKQGTNMLKHQFITFQKN
jgi:hypothetical protein